jgi:hypothetical protein
VSPAARPAAESAAAARVLLPGECSAEACGFADAQPAEAFAASARVLAQDECSVEACASAAAQPGQEFAAAARAQPRVECWAEAYAFAAAQPVEASVASVQVLVQDECWAEASAPAVQPDDSAPDEPAQFERADALVVPELAAERDEPAAPQQARLDAGSQQADYPDGLPADSPAPVLPADWAAPQPAEARYGAH